MECTGPLDPPTGMATTSTSDRTGPFWDAVHGRAPLPRAAATLGLQAALRNASGLLLATGTATLRVVERRPPG